MKRTLIPGLMLLAAFTLTNCSEQLVPPVQEDDVIVEETPSTEATEEEILGIPFEVYANASDEEVDTKTANVDGGNYTAWEATDAIYVYHAPAGSTSGFTKNHKFSMRNLAENLFGGALYKDANLNATSSYDWYFIYPNKEEGLGSAGTQSTVTANLVIGASADDDYTQIQEPITSTEGELVYSNKAHISGDNYPMYGKTAQSVFGNQNPRIQMKHLSALLAIKIVNQGHGGDIVINNAEIRANESIVGEFKVNITNSVATFDGEGYANSPNAKINMSGNGITIPRYQDGDANKGDGFTTLYLAIKPFTVSKGQSLSILINNSIRTITVTNDIKFESGKVTTLKVPIKHLVNETATDGGSYLTGKTNCTTFPVSLINGKSVSDMFVIGTENAPGSVTISGKLKNVLDILPIGFYAASWNGKQAAMIVDNVKAYIPISKYEIGMNLDRAALAEKINQDESFFVIYPYPVGTFTQTGKAQNLVILDEEPLQKAVDETKANTFIESYGITVAEVRSGINAPLIGASKEQKAARSKLFNLLCQFSAQINNISFLGDAVVCSALKYADCEVTLRTAAINEEKGVDDPRVVMWGLDIKGAQ